MKQILTRVTKGGQITLPSEIRKILGVGPQDRVAFELDGEEIRIVRPKSTLQSVKGSVKPATRTEDFDEMIRNAQLDMAKKGYGESE